MSDASPSGPWSGTTCSGWRAASFSRIASQVLALEPSAKFVGGRSFIARSPVRSVRSSTTKISSSPRVCAGPSHISRTFSQPIFVIEQDVRLAVSHLFEERRERRSFPEALYDGIAVALELLLLDTRPE